MDTSAGVTVTDWMATGGGVVLDQLTPLVHGAIESPGADYIHIVR